MSSAISKIILGAKAGSLNDLQALPQKEDDPLTSVTGYTKESFQAAYPAIPADKVFLFQTAVFQELVYWDRETCIMLYLRIYPGGQRMSLNPDQTDAEFSQEVAKEINRLSGYRKDKNYGPLLAGVSDAIALEILNIFMTEDGPSEELCNVFLDWYKISDYGFGCLDTAKVCELMKFMPEEIRKSSEEVIAPLPETVTVYRGEGDKSTPHTEAMSWSLSPNIALWYGTRLCRDGVLLVKGTVRKEDILFAYDADDYDREVILNPSTVHVTDIIEQYGSEVIMDFGYCTLYQEYRDKMLRLSHKKGSVAHDISHSARVLFLSLLIVDIMENESGAPFSLDFKRRVCNAAIYHDIGRHNDCVDPEHGKKSGQIYRKREHHEASFMVEWAIRNHCLPDDTARAELEQFFKTEEERKDAWTLLCVLKDADALDRVRFGRGPDGVDINQLRTEVSKRLYATAWSTYESLTVE